jgi:5'-AMP-activated protein kinase catalytic alpha subunit
MTVDPRNRYTIEEIRKHPWMMMNSCRKNNTQGIVIGYNKIPIDENVLFSLKDFNYDIDYASKCLEANRHNNITTTYYLALKKFIKEGGRTLCDLADKNFDKSLL